ncbi:MAG: hypothetical protein H7Y04_04845 [Verrucomicrobia bacterium]|nr:hypothetical protein [Cytophagales bacterium]
MESTENKNAKKKIENFDIAKVDETLQLATDLAKFIKENKLFHNIQGKEYVNVEGWQYAGSRLGIVPVVEELISIGGGDEVKYLSKVKLLNLRTDQIIGSGFAICSNKEQGKKFFQEYAVASMAQTRAIGKAYRNLLAWIIRAAGYEPTPAEEMDSMGFDSKNDLQTSTKNIAKTATLPQNTLQTEKPNVQLSPAQVSETVAEPAIENPANAKQKSQILLLLNNTVFTEDEKHKMIIQINKMDEEKAEKAIARLKKLIAERSNEKMAA